MITTLGIEVVRAGGYLILLGRPNSPKDMGGSILEGNALSLGVKNCRGDQEGPLNQTNRSHHP